MITSFDFASFRLVQLFRWVGFAAVLFFTIAIPAALALTEVGWDTLGAHVGFMFNVEYVKHPMFWACWLAVVYYPAKLIFDDQKSFFPWAT